MADDCRRENFVVVNFGRSATELVTDAVRWIIDSLCGNQIIPTAINTLFTLYATSNQLYGTLNLLYGN